MAYVKVTAKPLLSVGPGNGFSCKLSIGEATPEKGYAVNSVADCENAMATFAIEMKATGKPWMLSVLHDKKGGRKPAHFEAAVKEKRLQCFVNPHLAEQIP